MIEKLLKNLIEIPSVSTQEQKIAEFVFDYLRDFGLKLKLCNKNVYCYIGKGKKSLLLNSHLDTVPPTDSWTIEPFKAKVMRGRIYGLGACDVKASLAAMISAIVNLNNFEKELDGRVIFTATCEEEAGNNGLEEILDKLPSFDACIISEPTNLDICIAQKGIVRAKLIAKGKSAHPSSNLGKNAIHKAAKDILALQKIKFNKKHPLLGLPSIHSTLITGGIAKNIIPDRCEVILDIRSTPNYPNDYLIKLIKSSVKSDVEILSDRIKPKETSVKEKIVQCAKKANPNAKITGFFATSNFAFIDRPGIILGPGNPKQAHAENEFVEISQLRKASEIYQKIVENFLSFN